MIKPGTYGTHYKQSDGRTVGCEVTIGWPRRDGKYPVQISFAGAGRMFNKIRTAEQAQADIDKYATVKPEA